MARQGLQSVMNRDVLNWRHKVWGSLAMLLAVACAARVAWELLSVLVVPLLLILVIGGLLWFIFGRAR
jgi:cobalamin biosynthesis protein CobD/CbiB